MMSRITYYIYLWIQLSKLAFMSSAQTRVGAWLFIMGKLVRFGFFSYFLNILSQSVPQFQQIGFQPMYLIFLVLHFFDTTAQFFYRGIYTFRPLVLTGEFDYLLIRPNSILFSSLFRWTDILDLPLLVLVTVLLGRELVNYPAVLPLFLGAIIISWCVITAIHVILLALAIRSTEIEHGLWIYRELSRLALLPLWVYPDGLKQLILFATPIGIVYFLPDSVLLGSWTVSAYVGSIVVAIVVTFLSFKFWQMSLRQYQSASS